jgi:hypothetical protein
MLNHQPLNKLVATYQRAIYADEQKAAWLAWREIVELQIVQSTSWSSKSVLGAKAISAMKIFIL